MMLSIRDVLRAAGNKAAPHAIDVVVQDMIMSEILVTVNT